MGYLIIEWFLIIGYLIIEWSLIIRYLIIEWSLTALSHRLITSDFNAH